MIRWTTLAIALLACACDGGDDGRLRVTFPGSAVGAEAEVLSAQLERFMASRPEILVDQRVTPDAADQRHQLYVEWLNAGATDPDLLQLDVIWTAEFAAAGWILPLDPFQPDTADLFTASLDANRWRGRLYALPWFVDVGMLYYRTDLLAGPPADLAQLAREARLAQTSGQVRYGLVWQGARYEGLVTVFVEYLAAYGGSILDSGGRVMVDSEQAVRALAEMRSALRGSGLEADSVGFVPLDALTWHEEETRFAFQNGHALFMRNWPYAFPLMQDPEQSKVANRFAVAPMPPGAGGAPGAALGGQQLAINARSDVPAAAYAVLEFLTRPEQMLERARLLGQYPPRPSLYEGDQLTGAIAVPPEQARRIISAAVPRPVTPVYTELSQILQIHLHRALTNQAEPRAALIAAAREMRRLLERADLDRADLAG